MIRARFTTPLQIVEEPHIKQLCKEIADKEEVSLAAVYRRLIRKGLAAEGHSV